MKVNAVIDACAAGKANVAMLQDVGKKLFPLLGDVARGWIRLHLATRAFWPTPRGKRCTMEKISGRADLDCDFAHARRASAALAARETPLRLLVMISSPTTCVP